MSKMLRLELLGLVLLTFSQILTEEPGFYDAQPRYGTRFQEEIQTREVRVKQGRLKGLVVKPRTNHNLQLVDVFRGVPYAEPPVGSLRFSPPRSPEPWAETRRTEEFAPVCPQVLPDLRDEMKPGRYEHLEKHLPYLRNQSEDCLYLNIYAPHQPEGQRTLRKYPVMVFIHGESFEWNSGNPYDGTILAAYGNVVFVTINFRLGILGFLRPGLREDTASNFGLLDQIAALLWLRENIADFGGDPHSVTLVGHGTGAIFANLLLVSPVATKKGLFKRAILMSGSALSADAIGKAPLQITTQVAHALSCPTTTDSDLAFCLRAQEVDALLNVKIHKPRYVPAFAPLIDNAVIPDKPLNLMRDGRLFGRFDLMYGVTESEKFHVLAPVALMHGLLDGQRDEILRDHAKATHELEPELVLSKILEQYADYSSAVSSDYAKKNRDMVLDALSDSGTVGPLVQTANLHSRANPKSYMYVFAHPKVMQDYSGEQRLRTVHGEELAYVLGVPLDGSKYDLRRRYNAGETLFSEAMMNWWCSFAYIGNPNVAKRYPYLIGGFSDWAKYEVEWPEYDPQNQTYLNLTIPPTTGSQYRATEMQFWNEDLPNLLRRPRKGPRPSILDHADGIGRYANGTAANVYDVIGSTGEPFRVTETEGRSFYPSFVTTMRTETETEAGRESTTMEPSVLRVTSVMTLVIGLALIFVLVNFTAFLYVYRKRQSSGLAKEKKKTLKRRAVTREESSKRPKSEKHEIREYGDLGYKGDSKPDLNEVIKNDKAYDNNSNFGRRSKLSRQNSGSTIDTHIKVREWIQQEIVHRCSPRFLRKTRETLQKEHQEKLTKQQEEEKKRQEESYPKDQMEGPTYEESPALVVRPGKKSKAPKVSVAVDATPATRTESVLNQVPIELAKDLDPLSGPDSEYQTRDQFQLGPQVVVIEHHHSKSDPLPMETVYRSVKPNFSSSRIYESDSGSASSLYAKVNPKTKSRLPGRSPFIPNPDGDGLIHADDRVDYAKGSKLTTFAPPSGDINVTCREPTVERECVSPEEALRTIKRRNYPKVLPDIEKRRSLPAPSSLFHPKNSLRDYKNGPNSHLSSSHPPLPPPRIFGASKSLDFDEETEGQDTEPVTTNLHVGPLLRKQELRNNSDPNIMESFEDRGPHGIVQSGGSVDKIYSNPMCPVHGATYGLPTSFQSEKNIGKPSGSIDTGLGNPNWYRSGEKEASLASSVSEPRIVASPREALTAWSPEPRIIITPRVGNMLEQAEQNLSQAILNHPNLGTTSSEGRLEASPSEVKISHPEFNGSSPDVKVGSPETQMALRSRSTEELDEARGSCLSPEPKCPDRKEPRIIISPKPAGQSLKQPKIIIKPTSSLQRRDHPPRNIPKVSAIPPPEAAQPVEQRDQDTRPGLKERPKVTRIPSFSRRRDEQSSGPFVQEAAARVLEGKSGIPTFQKKESEKSSSTDSSMGAGSNTGTIKKKPPMK